MIRAWILLIGVLLAGAVLAQDVANGTTPAPAPAATDPTAAPAPAPVPAPGANTNTNTNTKNTATTAKSPDSFVPSEQISEDLSVSFPVDI